MNRKVLQNKSFLMAHSFNRTKMFHSKKGWLISSALILAMLGVATNAGHAQAHADANKLSNQQAKPTNPVQNKTSDKSNVPTVTSSASSDQKNVASQASSMHAGLMKLGLSKSTSSVASSSSSSTPKPSAKPTSESSVSSSSSDMTTFKLGTRSQQAKVWNYVQDGLKNNNFDNYKPSSSSASSTTKPASSIVSSTASSKSSSASASNSNAPKQVTNIHHNILGAPNPLETNPSNVTKSGQQPVIKHNLGDVNYFSGSIVGTGSDYGLDYEVWSNGGVEFTGGVAQSNLDTSNASGSEFLQYDHGSAKNVLTVQDAMKAKAIKFDDGIDTSHVTSMEQMFAFNSDLVSIDLGNNFDTSNVKNMYSMFERIPNLKSLNLGSKFHTGNVTNMAEMFSSDTSLPSLNLTDNFDTHNVKNMWSMFGNDYALTTLTLPNSFNTSNVTNMSAMFAYTPKLQTLIVPSSFTTSDVSDMSSMFSDTGIKSFDFIKQFDMKNVGNGASDMITSDVNLHSVTFPPSLSTHPSDPNAKYNPVTKNLNFKGYPTMFSDRFMHTPISSITITSPKTKLFINPYQHPLYKQLPELDNQGHHYTLSTPNDFTQGNVGTFVSTPNPRASTPITFRDIYSHNDKKVHIVPPSDKTIYGSPNSMYEIHAPKGWAFVTYSGKPINQTQSDFYGDGRTFFVAPDYEGMIYHYIRKINNDNVIDFTHDIHTGNVQGGEIPSDARRVIFDSDINTQNEANANLLSDFLTSNNHINRITIKSPNTKLPNSIKLNNFVPYTINASSDKSLSNQLNNIPYHHQASLSNGYTIYNPISSQNLKRIIIIPKGKIITKYVPKVFSKSPIIKRASHIAPFVVTHIFIIHTPNGTNTIYYEGKQKKNNIWISGAQLTSSILMPFYQHIKGGFTAPKPNDFSQGNVGTFGVVPLIPLDTVNYVYNGKTIAHQKFRAHEANYNLNTQSYSNPLDINMSHITSTHTLNKLSKKERRKLLNTFKKYHLVNPDNPIIFNGGSHDIAIAPNDKTDPITFINQHGQQIGNNNSSSVTGSPSDNVNLSSIQKVPEGYHVNANDSRNIFKYDGNAHNVYVQGNVIKGEATLYLDYEDASGNTISDTSTQIPINGQVGDSDMEIIPLNYDRTGYTNSDPIWSIPFKSSIAPNGDNNNYSPSHTFTYKADDEATVQIEYVDVDPNAISDGHGEVKFGKNTYPIVSDQVLPNIGRIGQTINLMAKGSNVTNPDVDKAVLQVPDGYHLANKNNKRIVPMSITLKPHNVSLVLMGEPRFLPQHHASTKSSATTTPIQPATIPSSATSSASSASVAPSSANSTSPVTTTPTVNNEATPAPVNKNFVVELKHQTLPQSDNTNNTKPVTSDNSTSTPTTSIQPTQKPKTIHKYVFVHVPPKHHTPMLAQQAQIPSRNNVKQVPQITSGGSTKLAQMPNKEVQSSSTNSTTPTLLQANTLTPTTNHSYSTNNTVITSKHSPKQLPQTDENTSNNSLFAIAIIMFSLGLAGVDLKHQFNS